MRRDEEFFFFPPWEQKELAFGGGIFSWPRGVSVFFIVFCAGSRVIILSMKYFFFVEVLGSEKRSGVTRQEMTYLLSSRARGTNDLVF